MNGATSPCGEIFYSVVGLESKDFRLAIHHGTQKRTDLSIESWIVDGEKIVRDHLYATSGSSGQNGIKTNASAFRHLSNGWNDDAVRQGFAECDNPAIQSVASVSNENWIEESAYRQKDRDNIEIEPDFFFDCPSQYLNVSDHAR